MIAIVIFLSPIQVEIVCIVSHLCETDFLVPHTSCQCKIIVSFLDPSDIGGKVVHFISIFISFK